MHVDGLTKKVLEPQLLETIGNWQHSEFDVKVGIEVHFVNRSSSDNTSACLFQLSIQNDMTHLSVTEIDTQLDSCFSFADPNTYRMIVFQGVPRNVSRSALI